MKAMVFAAGKGTRLYPVTETIPKCLVEVAGKTMLEHVVSRLKDTGVDEVIINVHHLAEQVKSFVRKKRYFGIIVSFSDEKELLETGGGLKRASSYFEREEAFFVHNSDVYSDLDLSAMYTYHKKHHALATLAVSSRRTSRYLRFTAGMELTGWENVKSGEVIHCQEQNEAEVVRKAFNGIHVLSPDIFSLMPEKEDVFSIIQTYLFAAKQGKSIRGYPDDDSFWMDMGAPEKLERLRHELKKT